MDAVPSDTLPMTTTTCSPGVKHAVEVMTNDAPGDAALGVSSI